MPADDRAQRVADDGATVRLDLLQEHELELILGNAFLTRGYQLPGSSGLFASLRLSIPPASRLVLVDGQSTPVAEVQVSAVQPESPDATWFAGAVSLLRKRRSFPFDPLRITPSAGPTTVLVDAGNPNMLAKEIRRAHQRGETTRVLPEPSAAHVPMSAREQHLASIASAVWGDSVTRIVRPRTENGGLVLFFTGLSGSGKSTAAAAVAQQLREGRGAVVTVLDGDEVRQMLSQGLGYSREDRDTNIQRLGYVAALIAEHGGIAICAPIAPYDATRKAVRAAVTARGGVFRLIHLSTPLAVCEQRDSKGLYTLARQGQLPHFTGVSDPYEVPDDADLTIDTSQETPASTTDLILGLLNGAS